MSLSSICKEQQKKDRQALKTFVFYSVLYSTMLHASMLTLAINGIWDRQQQQISDDPIEVVFIEEPELEPEPEPEEVVETPPPQEIIEEPEPEAEEIIETTVTQPQETIPEVTPEQVISEPVASSPETPTETTIARPIEQPQKLEQPEFVVPPEPIAEPNQPAQAFSQNPITEPQTESAPTPESLESDSFSEPVASDRSAPPKPTAATAGTQPSITQSNPLATFSQQSNFNDSINSPDGGDSSLSSPIASDRSAPPKPLAPTGSQPSLTQSNPQATLSDRGSLNDLASNSSNPDTESDPLGSPLNSRGSEERSRPSPPASVGTQPSSVQSESGFGDSFGGIGRSEDFYGNSDNPGDELASIGSPLQNPGGSRERPSRPSQSDRSSPDSDPWGSNSRSGSGGWGSNSELNGVECLECPRPRYPARARQRGWEGNPRLRIDTDDRGNVTNVSLEESSGHSILDEAAIEVVWEWKLEAKEGGRRGVTVTLKFELN